MATLLSVNLLNRPTFLASLVLTLSLGFGPALAIAQGAASQLPFSGSVLVSGGQVAVSATAHDDTVRLRIGNRRSTIDAINPTAIEVRPVQLTPRQAVLHVRIEAEHEVSALIATNGQTLWSGITSPVGDPGEGTWNVIETRDRTDDGSPDVVVAEQREGTRICGSELALLNPRAVELQSLVLRPVVLRPIPADREVPVAASVQPRREPIAGALFARASSSGSPRARELTDNDPETAWVEGRGGPGRWEFATVGLGSGARPVHAVQLTLPIEPLVSPREVLLVGSTADDQVTVLRVDLGDSPPGTELTVELPEPTPWTCLSVVLDRAGVESDTARVGLSEMSVLTDLDYGGGLDLLVRALVQDRGEEGDRAAHLLATLGEPALAAVEEAWETLSPTGRRRALRVAEANATLAPSGRLLGQGFADQDRAVRRESLRVAVAVGAEAWEPLVAALALAELETAEATDPEEAGQTEPTSSVAEVLAMIDADRAIEPLLRAFAAGGGSERPSLRRGLRRAVINSSTGADAHDAWIAEAPVSALASAALALAGTEHPLRDRLLAPAAEGAESFEDRYRTAAAAGGSEDARVHAWLLGQASSAEEWMIRERAVAALTPDLGWLREALADPYPRVRRSAVLQFAELDRHQAVRAAARDPWPLVRTLAPELSSAQDSALLGRLVRDRAFRVRVTAIEALTRHGDRSAADAVGARLSDDNEFPQVTAAAIAYASTLCLQELGEPLAAVVARGLLPNAWDPDVQAAAPALVALSRIDPVRAERVLERAQSPVSPASIQQSAQQAATVERCSPGGP